MTYLKCDLTGKPVVPSKGDKPIANIDFFFVQEKIVAKDSLEKWNKIVSERMATYDSYSFKTYKEEIIRLKEEYLTANEKK